MTRVLAPEQVREAAAALAAGQIVVLPTDTVYGVAALAEDERAVRGLFAAKGRDLSTALPVMVATAAAVERVAHTSPAFWQLAQRFWPGPLTLVLPKKPVVPDLVTGGGETVGVRVPDLPLMLELLQLLDAPLAITSANRSGQPPARSAAEAMEQLGGHVDAILDGGPSPGKLASTVLDLTTSPPRLLRRGPVSVEALKAVMGEIAA